jgi:hypothetical protein
LILEIETLSSSTYKLKKTLWRYSLFSYLYYHLLSSSNATEQNEMGREEEERDDTCASPPCAPTPGQRIHI